MLGVVFVHGVRSTPAMWEPFARLVADDEDLAGVVAEPTPRFGYATGIWPSPLRPLKVIPSISTAADSLKEYLVTEAGDFERLVLIGHSQGGLVIQRCLARMLSEGRGLELGRIRRVILLATPNTGSQLLLSARRVLVRGNPQEKELRPYEELVADTARIVARDIVNASGEPTPRSCRIPFSVYAGEQDKVVTRASAQALFPEAAALPGDHFSVARPTSAEHRSFATVKRLLRQAAQDGTGDRDPPVPGVAAVGPARLEVHSAADAADTGQGMVSASQPELTPYLPRAHDARLRTELKAVFAGGPSRLLMLTGESSTGKTRALFEAVRALAPDAPLLHPAGAQDLLALLRAGKVRSGCVLWLNEAQRFLYGTDGEKAAAGLHQLLNTTAGIAAVGTLWTTPYWHELTATVAGNPHGQARALLTHPAFAQRIDVPAQLRNADTRAWRELAASSGDSRLRQALDAAGQDGRVIQHLSGGPELLQAYLSGPGGFFTHREHALLTAALDARRLGHRRPLSAALLAQAADGDLPARHRSPDQNWAAEELRSLTSGERADGSRSDVRSTLKALTAVYPTSGAEPGYEPADYLQQHLQKLHADRRGTPSLWRSLLVHTLDPDDQDELADAAWARGLRTTAARLWHLAVLAGRPADALVNLDPVLDPDHEAITYALEHADLTDTPTVTWILSELQNRNNQPGTTALLARDPAAHADVTNSEAIGELLGELWRAGDEVAAGRLAERACADVDDSDAGRVSRLLATLLQAEQDRRVSDWPRRLSSGEPVTAEEVMEFLHALRMAGADDALASLAERSATHASIQDLHSALVLIFDLRQIGQDGAASTLTRRAIAQADLSDVDGVGQLLEELRETEDHTGLATLLARDPAGHADPSQLHAYPRLLHELIAARDAAGARRLLDQLNTRKTDPAALVYLLSEFQETGDHADAAALLEQLDVAGLNTANPYMVRYLLEALWAHGDQQARARHLSERAATEVDVSDGCAAVRLMEDLWNAGEGQAAVRLAERITISAGHTSPTAGGHLITQLSEADQQRIVLMVGRLAHGPVLGKCACAGLHRILTKAGESQAAPLLSEYVSRHGCPTQLGTVIELVRRLSESGDDRGAEWLAGRLAAHVPLADAVLVADLLNAFNWVGNSEPYGILLERDPAAHIDLSGWPERTSSQLDSILRELAHWGDPDAADRLRARIQDAGYRPQDFAPFGREPDGSPSAPWTWSSTTAVGPALSTASSQQPMT